MHIIYKITYLPHLNTQYPKYYIGSKYNYKGNYYGSVSSMKIFEFTNGIELRKWWKLQIKNNPENFKFEIIMKYENIIPQELVLYESKYQHENNCIGQDYFNQSFACGKFISTKNSEETRKKKSLKTKQYWNTLDGIEKRKRLSDRNKITKSNELKEKWKNNRNEMLKRLNFLGRRKGSKDLKKRKIKNNIRKIHYNNIIYENAIIASNVYNIHPVSIRRKCRLQIDGWRYI